ncbi:MAG: hypothetical protein ACRCX4_02200 [Bacteroidales bacterium]
MHCKFNLAIILNSGRYRDACFCSTKYVFVRLEIRILMERNTYFVAEKYVLRD